MDELKKRQVCSDSGMEYPLVCRDMRRVWGW
jgi:hypothetical protein